ncbi:hydrophobin [Phlebiopsis gigantea 11061_1 CR5-6]|uniref:Hydrophobin n=1 Tax=Phlebiopsis gigantea (strain 11061_1 CR5-6) TaxID=745531 RepID=A0A0C3S4X6_PHLG1|nr:hydrophobin [Phlebiopsis gigantea 11061_1 CR5-6]
MRALQGFVELSTAFAFALLAVATPVQLGVRDPEPASQCQTPPIRCCGSVLGEDALPAAITELLPPGLNATQIGDVGLNCTTVDISTNPLSPTPQCDGSTVCCGGNIGDAAAFNCVLVTIPTPSLVPTLSLPTVSLPSISLPGLPSLTSISLPGSVPSLTSISLPGLPSLTSILPLPTLSLPGLYLERATYPTSRDENCRTRMFAEYADEA